MIVIQNIARRVIICLSLALSCFTGHAAGVDTIGLRSDRRYKEIRDEWRRRKGEIADLRNKLSTQAERLATKDPGAARQKMLEWKTRISSLNITLRNLDTLEKSSQIYTLKDTSFQSNAGETLTRCVARGKDTLIEFLIINIASFVHETTHGGQFELGKMAYFRTKKGGSIADDLFDERDAYRAQYAFDPDFVSRLGKSALSGASAITPEWVRNLAYPNGCLLYDTSVNRIAANGDSCIPANVAWIEVTITSPKAVLEKAYPGVFGAWKDSPTYYIL
ncbi:MAG TPA: hypothetical protein VNW04_18520, partial [Puia sp.]|nr:hypothetical protein [Puia sp.]